MLQLLTGRAGSGKTKEVLCQMRREGTRRPQILLVPEQASFEMEMRLCEENGNGAGLYGEVFSFTRLEHRVLSLVGGNAQPVLDEGGRLLVMYAALRSVAGNLSVYAMPSRKPEFLSSLLKTVDELKSYCVNAADLGQVAAETEGIEGRKLGDLALIFGAYEAMTARGSLDPRDRLTRLAGKLKTHPFAEEKDFYLDGFTDFTPQETLVLEQLLCRAHSVTVTLTCDLPGGLGEEDDVFAPARRTAAQLTRLAKKCRCPLAEKTVVRPMADTPLHHLEAQLFAKVPTVYAGKWKREVGLRNLPSRRDEAEWTAGEIRRLVEEEHYRYRDLAVAARSIEPYQEWLESYFAQYGIPAFQAQMSDILQKPMFTLIIAALDAVTAGYSYEEMFRYLKTGLTDLTQEECDALENYVLTWDIRGSKWTRKWTMHPGGYYQKFSEKDRIALERLDQLRCKVISPFKKLQGKGRKTVKEQVLLLYSFLEKIHLPERLEERTNQLMERGEPERAEEYRQLWTIFCTALEQCVELLGEMEIEREEFSRLMRLLLSCYCVGTIPASLDRVTVGDAPRIANRRVKVLFLLGADDSSIPQVTPGQGLLTEEDRALLEVYGWQLSPRLEERIYREKTIVYTVCTQPEEKLWVTWPSVGESGGEERPSYLVKRLGKLFPKAAGQPEHVWSPEELLRLSFVQPELRKALSVRPEIQARFQRMEQAARWRRGRLSPGMVDRLYGKRIAMSASRMDRYQSCHFAYFMKFGLAARERKPAGFHAPEYGTFLHFVLEQVLRQVQEEGGIQAVGEDALQTFTRQAVRRYVAEVLGGMENQTPRFQYLFRRLLKTVQAVVENVTAELRSSDFQPIRFELGFGTGQELPPVELTAHGVTLSLSGFVDRVDGWVKDGRLYLRVIDYKTGRKSFDLTEIWNGLGLQMLLYLFTLERNGEALFGQPVSPAGVLYLPAREAAVSGSRSMEEGVRRRLIDRELVRRGLVLDDPAVLEAMEHAEQETRFLPIRVSPRTGKINGDCLVSIQKLGRLREHTEKILGDICRELAAGNIDADPFWRGPAKNACQYCEFLQACQFEEGADWRRWIPTVKNRDFWDWLERRGEESETHAP